MNNKQAISPTAPIQPFSRVAASDDKTRNRSGVRENTYLGIGFLADNMRLISSERSDPIFCGFFPLI
jgi:hypothetical protein